MIDFGGYDNDPRDDDGAFWIVLGSFAVVCALCFGALWAATHWS